MGFQALAARTRPIPFSPPELATAASGEVDGERARLRAISYYLVEGILKGRGGV